ncbi:hypothetical protein [Mycetocola saprophilus]|uniref:hypothetical protein n=1 Tax=Mycetocola saprophilus TaxID=76636 RepID=UPI0004C085EB|nr:hypothetical protein [Mycetocola saprophilus]
MVDNLSAPPSIARTPRGVAWLGRRIPGTGAPARLGLLVTYLFFVGIFCLMAIDYEDPETILDTVQGGLFALLPVFAPLILRAPFVGVWDAGDLILVRSWFSTQRFAKADIVRVSTTAHSAWRVLAWGSPRDRVRSLTLGLGVSNARLIFPTAAVRRGRARTALSALAAALGLPSRVMEFPGALDDLVIGTDVREATHAIDTAPATHLMSPPPVGSHWRRVSGTGLMSLFFALPLSALAGVLAWSAIVGDPNVLDDDGDVLVSYPLGIFFLFCMVACALSVLGSGIFVRGGTVLLLRFGFPTIINHGEATRVDRVGSMLPWGDSIRITTRTGPIRMWMLTSFSGDTRRIRTEISRALGLLTTDSTRKDRV